MSADANNTISVDRHAHWDAIYRAKDEAQLSWHQDDPRKGTSFELIREFAEPDARIIDIGGGSSTLAGELIKSGFSNVTVLDVSEAAIERAKMRVGDAATRINWIAADAVASPSLPGGFDVWHDRAVFHFLTAAEDRRKYIDLCSRSVASGGHVVIATFAPDGPEKCSGLPVQRYDAPGIGVEFNARFEVVKCASETHITPWGKPQAFTYAVLRKCDRA